MPKVIAEYDREQAEYIRELEVENDRLKEQVRELTDLAVRGAMASDRMKLELILGGGVPTPANVDADVACG